MNSREDIEFDKVSEAFCILAWFDCRQHFAVFAPESGFQEAFSFFVSIPFLQIVDQGYVEDFALVLEAVL